MANEIYNEDFFTIFGFMRNDLNLEGTELNIYAIIYGYSKDGVHDYHGSQQYLANWVGKSKTAIQRALNNLIEKELILKEEIWTDNNIKYCKYKANLTRIQNDTGISETTVNNIYNNINNNINNKDIIEPRNDTGTDLVEELFNAYTENNDLYDMLMEFRDFRNEKKKPLTERSAKMILNKLNELKNDKDKINCLERSIMSGWTSVFPESVNNTPKKKSLHDESDLKGVIRPTKRRIDS